MTTSDGPERGSPGDAPDGRPHPMPDRTDPPHQLDPELDEIVSAVLDGEASPHEVARVEGDPALSARLGELRAVAAAVAAPVAPPSAAARDEAIAAALGASADPSAPAAAGAHASRDDVVDMAVARDRLRRQRRILAVAAAVLVAVLALPLLGGVLDGEETADELSSVGSAIADSGEGGGGSAETGAAERSDDEDDAAATTTTSGPAASAAEPSAGASAYTSAQLDDLGSFSSIGELAAEVEARALEGFDTTSDAPATTTSPDRPAAPDDAASLAPCDALGARAVPPGTVTSVGSATLEGRPVTVLVVVPFNPTVGPLLLVADPGCGEVVDQIALGG